MTRTRVFRLMVLVLLAIVAGAGSPAAGQLVEPLEVVVTNTGDGPGECPHLTNCTLRAAIELVNGDTGDSPYVIGFDAVIFDGGTASVIEIEADPLPLLERDNVSILADDSAVMIDGGGLDGDGLVLAGGSSSLEGVNVRGFIDACIRVTGPSTRLTRVTTDGCAVGIAVQGPGVTVTQSRVGLDAREGDAVMLAGVLVQASDVAIGSLEGDSSEGNTIGNVHTGVLFATVSGELAGGVVGGNRIGEDTGEAAPVEAGVRIEPRASGVQVIANDFSNITRAAIDVTDGDPPPIANRFAGNRYDLRGGMAIDLGSDGVRNENGPSDDGPNRLQNHPVITRPTQASIAGEVPGCGPGCIVELYRVRHEAGGGNDTPTIPLGTVITDADAGFTFEAPALVPGDWVMATATDLEGNTSEFGPSVRVGTGVVQCGNVSLKQGWNLVGYFGPGPLALNEAFPGENGARVRAVYQLVNGTETYTHWIAGTAVGRTLTTLHPGEAYWFLVDGPVTLPEGFSLGVGLPVTLLPGWNAFVYIGASGDPADALGELAAKYSTIYRWNNDGPVGAWERYAPLAPGYVNGVEEIRACDSYVILMDEAGVLTPLQP